MAIVNSRPGDKVKLRLALEEVEGTVLESPDPSSILLKLNSGYNIGIPQENILGGKITQHYHEESPPEFQLKKRKELASIGLVITGGTIASKLDPRTGGVKPLTDLNELQRFYPDLFEIANVKRIEMPFKIASESMSAEHWITIAKAVKSLLDDPEIKGVVVTHGTDFLHYTSAALSFFLRDLSKPVVLTYSQRSIDRASSDAHLNLQCATRMALSDAAEVMVVGHATLNDDYCYALRGTKVKKMHSSRRDAFQPINESPIAKIFTNKIIFQASYKKRTNKTTQGDIGFSDRIALLKFYPGQDPNILDFYASHYSGIIIEASGLGHLPVNEAQHNWLPKLKKYIRGGFIVCAVSQTIVGRVDPYVYSNGRELLDAGIIFLEDMTAETAFVKLGWVLSHHGWKKHVKERMLENVAGELSQRLPVTDNIL